MNFEVNVIFLQDQKSHDKNLDILRRKRAFKIK